MSNRPVHPIATWIAAARPKTLWAAFSPVLVGVAMAVRDEVVHVPSAVLALVGALLIQIGTNFYNDYADFEKGADTLARKGPLRVTQAGLVDPRTMKRATILVFVMAVIAGGYLMIRGGWPIVVIGLLSILFGILYTAGRHSLAYLGIADIFVFVFFGPVAVGGTYYVQGLSITWPVIVAGLAPGLLSVAILLVNNIRDIDEDRAAGKMTLVARFGRKTGLGLYALCIGAAMILPIGLFLAGVGNGWAMLSVILLPVGLFELRRIANTEGEALNASLGATARLLLLYSILFSVGWNL